MRTQTLIVATAALAVSSCDVSGVSGAATDLRTAAERSAAEALDADRAKVARIASEVAVAQQREAFRLGDRYHLRPDAEGWTVVDRATNQAAEIKDTTTQGLSLEAAREMATELQETKP